MDNDLKNLTMIVIVAILAITSTFTEGLLSDLCATSALIVCFGSLPGIVIHTIEQLNKGVDEDEEELAYGWEENEKEEVGK